MALTKVSTPAIKDEAITLAKLLHGDSNSNGKFLRANNGADPTFETVNTDLVSDTSPQLGGNLDTNGSLVIFPDSNGTTNRLLFGTNKFQMLYDSGNSRMMIDNSTGDFTIRNQASGGDIDIIASDDIRIRPQGGENGITLLGDGAVELYHDNVKKVSTQSWGLEIIGNIHADDNYNLILGSSNDLNIYHDGSKSVIDSTTTNLDIQSSGAINIKPADANGITAFNGGAVELYHNASKKFETVSNGVIIDNTCRIENINNKVSSMVNAVNNLEYKIHQTNGQSALQAAIISKGISGWGGDLELYTKLADSNPNGSLTRRARLTDAGYFVLSHQPYAMVSRGGANQSIAHVTGVIIQFNQEHYDTANNYNPSNYRFTAPVDGVYQVNVQVQYNGNVNQTHAGLYKNGSSTLGINNTFDAWCNWGDNIRAGYFAQAIKLSANDYIQAVTYQGSGSTQEIEQNRTKMTIYLLG